MSTKSSSPIRTIAIVVAVRARLGWLRQGLRIVRITNNTRVWVAAILRTGGVKLRLACTKEVKQHEAKSKRRYKPFHSNSNRWERPTDAVLSRSERLWPNLADTTVSEISEVV
jgi:hypothetical protein